MPMIRRSVLLLALTILATAAPMATAQACSCMAPDPARFLAESDFVFAGSLIERPEGAGAIGEFGGESVAYLFEVDAVYKGDLRDATVQVWSASSGAACGFEMPLGEPVAIAVMLSGGQLTSGLCSTFGVEQLEAAAEQAGVQPTIPSPPTDPVDVAGEEEGAPSEAASVVIATVALAAIAVAAILMRRRTTRV